MHPCGLAVDVLRSCYRTNLVIGTGTSEQLVPIRWYFVDDDVDFLPFPTIYRSANWLKDEIAELPVWEKADTVPEYDSGTPIDPSGQLFIPCGDEGNWSGETFPESCSVDVRGVPDCCLEPN